MNKDRSSRRLVPLALLGALLLGSGSAQSEHDNLRGIKVCIDNKSFTAKIGTLTSTSQQVAQGLYDYFVDRMTRERISFFENGDRSCVDYIVSLTFAATNGTPRAWYGTFDVLDDGAFASTNADDRYTQPVSIWVTTYYGVHTSNDGLANTLLGQGKTMIDEFIKAYSSVNR